MQITKIPPNITAFLCIGSYELEDMRTAFCPEEFPFSMVFWRQKNPQLLCLDNPDIFRSSVAITLCERESFSVNSILIEAWERLKPHWNKIYEVCEKNGFKWDILVEVRLKENIQQIQFGISHEILEEFPWGTEFAIVLLNREGKAQDYGSDECCAEDEFLEPLMRISIESFSCEEYSKFQKRAQDLDTFIMDALNFWTQTQIFPQIISSPKIIKIRIEPINLYRIGLYLDDTTIQKLREINCRLDIRFQK